MGKGWRFSQPFFKTLIMVKVKFTKDHLGHAKGDVIEVTPERANYFALTGTATEVKAESHKEAPKKTAKKK